MESENKYNREIFDLVTDNSVTVDVYNVLVAFNVTCPARQHAIKKLLCAGLRGKGDAVQDLTEAGKSITRAIRLAQRANKTTLREGAALGNAFLIQGDNVPRPPVKPYICPQCNEAVSYLGRDKKWPGRCDRCVEKLTNALGGPVEVAPQGFIEALCRVCHNRINYPAGQMGDCVCSRCRADIDNPGAEQARIDHAFPKPTAPEPLPPEGTCNTPCGNCGRLINYALASEPIPKICSTCAHAARVKIDRAKAEQPQPETPAVVNTGKDDWEADWE